MSATTQQGETAGYGMLRNGIPAYNRLQYEKDISKLADITEAEAERAERMAQLTTDESNEWLARGLAGETASVHRHMALLALIQAKHREWHLRMKTKGGNAHAKRELERALAGEARAAEADDIAEREMKRCGLDQWTYNELQEDAVR